MLRTRIGKVGWVLFLIVILLWATSTVVAGPLQQSDESPGPADVTPVPPLETEVPAESSPEELVSAASVLAPAAIPSAQMNYQGYLTDAGGQPLDGAFEMTFRLFNDPAAGTQVWGDEVHTGVVVSRGLFQVILGETVPLDVADFATQLYLESVVGTTVLPRQMLRAVPYAMGLVGGAHVEANTASETAYAINVFNSGGRGIAVDAKGNGLYGLYNYDVTYSSEGYAGPDTELWIPALNAEINYIDIGSAHLEYGAYGNTVVQATAVDSVRVLLPVQIEQPYGRSYQLKSATIYYKTDAPNSKIITTWLLGRNMSTGTDLMLGVDNTDYAATVYSSYTMTLDPPAVLSVTNMLTNLEFLINMTNATGTVTIYGVRLTLDSSY